MLLRDARPEIRTRAALALGRIGDGATSALLLASLRADEQPAVRAAAAFALGEVGESDAYPAETEQTAELVAQGLAAALDDGEELVAARAAEALGKRGTTSTLPALLGHAGGSAVQRRRAVLLALWRVNIPDDDAALHRRRSEVLAAAARAPEREVRWAAGYSLMRLAEPDMISALLALARDADPGIRALAAAGLGRVPASSEPAGSDTVEPAMLTALADQDAHVRVAAIRSLGRRPTASGFTALARLLADANRHVLRATVVALGRAAPAIRKDLTAEMTAPVVARLKAMIAAPPSLPETQEAATSIAQVLGPESRPYWRELATSEVASARLAAAAGLSALGKDGDIGELLGLVQDADPGVAMQAMDGITATLGRSSTVPAEKATANGLMNLFSSRNREGRGAAIGMHRRLRDDNPYVRAAATAALAKLDHEDVAAFIFEALERAHADAEPDAKTAAFEALAEVTLGDGDRVTAETLARRALGEDENYLVRRAAARFLAHLGVPAVADARPVRVGRSLQDYAALLAAPRSQLRLATSAGDIVVRLLPGDAPITVANFVRLARARYFDGQVFHRVEPSFVVQGGDPEGTGWGGPGFSQRCEVNGVPFTRGTVGMALSGKDTGGSQFFIAHTPQPHLDGGYTVFGQVVSGMDVVDRLNPGDRILRVSVEDDSTGR